MTSLINEFKTDTVNVLRNSGSGGYSDTNGMYIEGKKESLKFDVVVRPASGKDLLRLPEGQRTKEVIRIYSKERLFTAQDSLSKVADCVEYRGCTYQVDNVSDNTSTDLNHFKSLATKVEDDAKDRILK